MKIRTWFSMLLGAAIGAGATYYLDPQHGAERRADLLTKGRERARELELDKQAQHLLNQAKGGFREVVPSFGEQVANDATLAHKVESEVVGPMGLSRDQVIVEAADGVVTLRGQVGVERQIQELTSRTQGVEGVRQVRNLLHLPSESAPTRPGT